MMTVLKHYNDKKLHCCTNIYDEENQKHKLIYCCDSENTEFFTHELVRKQHVKGIPVYGKPECIYKFETLQDDDNNRYTINYEQPEDYKELDILRSDSLYMNGKALIDKYYHNVCINKLLNSKADFDYVRTIFYNYDINKLNIAINNELLNKKYLELNNNSIFITVEWNIQITLTNIKVNYSNYAPYKTIEADASISFIYYECGQCGQLFLNTPNSNCAENTVSIKMYDDDDKIKASAFIKRVMFVKNSPFKSYRKNMLVFKKDNFKMYYIYNVGVKGISYFKKNFPLTICNATYKVSNFHNSQIFGGKRLEVFFDKINDYLKAVEPDLYRYTNNDKAYIENKLTKRFELMDNKNCLDKLSPTPMRMKIDPLYTLIYVKKMLNINSTLLAEFILYSKSVNFKDIMTKLHGKTESEIMAYLGLNNKLLNNIIINNRVRKFLLAKSITDNLGYINMILNMDQSSFFIMPQKTIRNFMKETGIKEQWIINSVLKRQYSFLADLINMYKDIKEFNPEYKLKIKKDIEETHDNIMKDYNIAKNTNRPIEPVDKLNKLFNTVEYSDIKYVMPRDTNELVNVGNLMDNCVATYSNKAVKKQCYIVVGYDKDGNPKTCIELQKHNSWELIQVKKIYNNYPCEEEAKAIAKICKSNKIKIDYCSDINQYKKIS